MNTLIIYAHPWDGSFNKMVLDDTINILKKRGHFIDIIDLNKDGFNPVMTTADLKVFGRGEYADPLAADYVKRLKKADEVVFIYPIWWYGEPAILKGFFDKVFLKGQAYGEVDRVLTGLLDIKKATILTTANIGKDFFESIGNPIMNVVAGGIFKMVGINDVSWFHCEKVHLEENRIKYLKDIEEHFA